MRSYKVLIRVTVNTHAAPVAHGQIQVCNYLCCLVLLAFYKPSYLYVCWIEDLFECQSRLAAGVSACGGCYRSLVSKEDIVCKLWAIFTSTFGDLSCRKKKQRRLWSVASCCLTGTQCNDCWAKGWCVNVL